MYVHIVHVQTCIINYKSNYLHTVCVKYVHLHNYMYVYMYISYIHVHVNTVVCFLYSPLHCQSGHCCSCHFLIKTGGNMVEIGSSIRPPGEEG